ncbi:hypothetical protein BG004_007766 [Podila humilis]|nr:hypothetical protein BG004_007766 [Podila humilis]
MSIWAELYFDATPAWFPDSRRVFTDTVDSIAQGPPRPPPSFKAATATAAQRSSSRMTEEERSKDMTMTSFFRGQGSQRKNLYRAKDPWYASQFDQGYIQQLVFPGFVSPAPTQQQQHQLLNHRSTDSGSSAMSRPPRSLRQVSSNLSEARVVIPPALALLKGGPEMHAYYALVQHLRTKRRQQVQTAFMAWHIWATKRSEARQAQDAGWGIVDFSEEELEQEQKQKQEQEDDDERSNRRHHDRRRQPRLVVVAAKKGVDIEMDRVILAKEPFFGHGPIEYEDETEEEEEEEDEEDQGLEITGVTQTKLGPSESRIESDEVDGFDDFGFPVDVSSL